MTEIDKQASQHRRLSRRQFLWLAAGSVALACTGCERRRAEPRIGLALGGGGAKGLAHILMLETFDELGIRPHIIAGTSIGAIIGALYAAGLSGEEIRLLIEQFLVAERDTDSMLPPLPESLRWLDFIDPELGSGGLLDSSDFIEFLGEQLPMQHFRKLEIPLKVVASDLLTGNQVVIESGTVLPALKASMAVPGVFRPVELDGRKLIDGGVSNPLPYDLLLDKCDIVVAIDVSGDRELEDEKALSAMGVLLHSFHTMSNNIVAEKLKQQRPDIYIRPEIRNVRVLEFYKAKQIFEESQPAQRQLNKALKKAMRTHDGRWGCSMA
jgi:NTE family protein